MRFAAMETMSRAAILFLGFFVGTGVVIAVALLWLLSSWGDDEQPFD